MSEAIDPQLVARLCDYQDSLERARMDGLERYLAAFEDPPAGVVAHEIDLEKRVVRVNDAELHLLGYAREQMLGRPIWEFIVLHDASQRAIEKKLTGEKALLPFLRSFVRSDGRAVLLLVLDRHLRDAAGAITGIRTVMVESPSGAANP